ncbi:MAG: hydantoinase B/oxoprolinase family protein [Gammaproteobacteria bacterium]|nr:MAG: hydantoinase B/oxoprolinase family protein [Gammaproteobacteria bacterium]
MAQNSRQSSAANIDPITFSVVWNKLEYLTAQIGEKILYSTQSFVTALARDLGQTILDARGKIVVAATAAPIHTLVAEEAIKGLEATFHGDYQPGDFIVANDPYIVRGGHLPDWNFIRPMFFEGEHLGFLQAKTHVSDTGGFLPGGYGAGAYDIIAEGLNIPPLKIIRAGELQRELWDLILRNVRMPTELDMDTRLINGCMAQAEEQIAALCRKYGVETIKACMAGIIAAGERAMRAEIARIPDGHYHGESTTDWDGHTDRPVHVRVEAIVAGDELTFDFSASDAQATFVNCPVGATITSAMVGLFYLVDASVPKNGGALNPIHFVLPEGSVVNPRYPATVGASQISVGTQIVEACMLAIGRALPERAMAAWSRHLCPINIGTQPDVIDPRTDHPRNYFTETFGSDGGSGAVKGFDGWLGAGFQSACANLVRPNVEHFESSSPYLVTHYEVLQDWEGAGQYRGSPGSYVRFVTRTLPGAMSLLMTGNSDGQRSAPAGVAGGGSGPCAEMEIIGTDGAHRVLRTFVTEPIRPGEACEARNPGGGGWGDPLRRDPARVSEDLRNGFVSVARAREVYGVIVTADGYTIDAAATARQREALPISQCSLTPGPVE